MHSLSIQNETDRLLSHIKDGSPMTFSQRLSLTLRLSFPAILAQLSSIVMQYIDAAMVGSLGAEDTLVPCLMNLLSIWGVRLTLAAVLAPKLGLRGVWIAMCIELCFRGIIFLVRLFRKRWLRRYESV